jgi:hypothetical protein
MIAASFIEQNVPLNKHSLRIFPVEAAHSNNRIIPSLNSFSTESTVFFVAVRDVYPQRNSVDNEFSWCASRLDSESAVEGSMQAESRTWRVSHSGQTR